MINSAAKINQVITSEGEIFQLCPWIFVKPTTITRVITERLTNVNMLFNTADSLMPIIKNTKENYVRYFFLLHNFTYELWQGISS